MKQSRALSEPRASASGSTRSLTVAALDWINMIFDTHCHGYWNGLKHRQAQVRENMCAANVKRLVQVGVDWEMSRIALDLARDWGDRTWCSVGMHPTSCQDLPGNSAEEWATRFEKLIRDNRDKIVAVGEIGFDYYHLDSRKGNRPERNPARVLPRSDCASASTGSPNNRSQSQRRSRYFDSVEKMRH